MKKYIKRMIKGAVRAMGYEIVNARFSLADYFFKPKDIIVNESLMRVRKTIYEDSPSPMYRESYHIHQIGAWGPLPSLVYMLGKTRSMAAPLRSLDIGCAFGTMAAFMSCLGYRVSAIDFVPLETYLGAKTRDKYNIDFHETLIETENLPFAPKTFDLITLTEVLEHFKYQPLDTLKKIVETLKDDGVFLMTTPALGAHWTAEAHDCPFEKIPSYQGEPIDKKDRHWKIYDLKELQRLLEAAGLDAFVGLQLNINTGAEGLYAVAVKRQRLP